MELPYSQQRTFHTSSTLLLCHGIAFLAANKPKLKVGGVNNASKVC